MTSLSKPLADCRLYAFVDAAYLAGRCPAELTRQLCGGGADLVQLRAKEWSGDQLRRTAADLQPITAAHGVRLVINDDWRLAMDLPSDVVHLGQEDFFDGGWNHVSQLRRPGSAIEFGLSSHSPAQAERAVAAGADYVAVGPVYATPTKPGRPAVTLSLVRWAAANLGAPWFAIGGITRDTLPAVLDAGATRVCVVSAFLQSANPEGVCREFRRRLDFTIG